MNRELGDQFSLLPESIPLRKEDFRLEQLDDEMLLFHPSTAQVYYLNQTASLVWGLCDGKRSFGEILRLLENLYPESSAQIELDVRATLELFIRNGVIELKNERV